MSLLTLNLNQRACFDNHKVPYCLGVEVMGRGISINPFTNGCSLTASLFRVRVLSLEWIGVSFWVLWDEN